MPNDSTPDRVTGGPQVLDSRRSLMLQRLLFVLKERDRFWTVLAPGVFALYSAWRPSPSMMLLPSFAEWSTYALLLTASPLLLIGMYRPSWHLLVVGHILVVCGALTVGGVVLATTESPVALLVFAYATAMSYSLQRQLRERHLLREIADHHSAASQPRSEEDS